MVVNIVISVEEWRMSLTRDYGEELVKSMEGSGLCLVVGLVVRIK